MHKLIHRNGIFQMDTRFTRSSVLDIYFTRNLVMTMKIKAYLRNVSFLKTPKRIFQ
jgi:hypothetical protein